MSTSWCVYVRKKVLRALFCSVVLAIVLSAAVSQAFADTINGHTVVLDSSGKIIPWTSDPTLGYDTVVNLAWGYLLNNVPTASNGKPVYYSYSYLDPDTQQPQNWPFNPAGMYAMLTESALKYYQYSGNRAAVTVAENVATWHLQHGMTSASDSWPNVPYSEGDAGSLTYQGASYGNTSGIGDGQGYLEPDKIGELAYAWLTLYQFDGNTAYRDAAIQAADVLAAKVRTGNATQSPWPFKVNAHTGAVREDYSADTLGPIRLFDLLIKLGLGNTANYQTARQTAWTWLMTYPIQNNVWANYFEDSAIQPNLANTTQYTALMTARYLLEHPAYDANWQTHVQSILSWVKTNFLVSAYGASTIEEQATFAYPMGSHTSRYASVNALLYELTGSTTAQQEAIRSFNWATYMARTSGIVIDGPLVNHLWFTDGYGDYIRHFLTGMGAMPTLAPAAQNHLLRSTSVVQNIAYSGSGIAYTTYDAAATEVLRINFVPSGITAGGNTLTQNTDLSQEGFTFDASTGVLRIRHDSNGTIQILSGGTPINLAPSVSLTAPVSGASYQAPASIALTASASDSDGSVAEVDFYNGTTLLGTSFSAPYSYTWNGVTAGAYSLTAVATDNLGATTTSAPVTVSVTVNAPSTLPTGWLTADIGSVGVAGSANYTNGVFTVQGSGTNISGTADSFRFVYLPLSGNGQIVARVLNVQNIASTSLAGVMVRESLSAGAREALVDITAGGSIEFRRRTSTNNTTSTTTAATGSVPYMLRLRRQGSTFTAYRSSDGSAWTQIGSATLNMATNVYIGLAVGSRVNTALSTSTFDYVSAGANVDTTPPTISQVAAAVNQSGTPPTTISWTTSEPADSQVRYGTTTSYGLTTTLDSSLVVNHTQALANLTTGATYHYQVRSRDAAGNLAISGDYTFTVSAPADTQAPTAPANLGASATSATSIALSWTASTDDTGVKNYVVYRNGAQIGTSTATSYSSTGLSPNTAYSFTVTAVDAAGNVSNPSNTATARTLADTAPPSAPSNLAGVSSADGTQVSLSWTASTDNIGVTAYQIWRNGGAVGTSTVPSFTDTGLTPGVNYAYAVTAQDAAGNVSGASLSIAVTTTVPVAAQTPPSPPASLSASPVGSTQVNLAWTGATAGSNAVAGYQIWRNGVQIGASLNLTYVDTNVQASTAYTYTVRAYDASGLASLDSPAAATSTLAPGVLAIDNIYSRTQTSITSSMTSAAVSTSGNNELLVAFITADGPNGSAQTFSSVTGGGLTWTLRKRSNAQAGTSEIWQAVAAAPVSGITVTAVLARPNSAYQGAITVVAFQNASLNVVGATAGGSASSGTPTASLVTTKTNSWIWGTGNDWDNAKARTVGSNQTKVYEALTSSGDTYWVQRQNAVTAGAGTTVVLNDTAPTTDRWNLATIEVLAY